MSSSLNEVYLAVELTTWPLSYDLINKFFQQHNLADEFDYSKLAKQENKVGRTDSVNEERNRYLILIGRSRTQLTI